MSRCVTLWRDISIENTATGQGFPLSPPSAMPSARLSASAVFPIEGRAAMMTISPR